MAYQDSPTHRSALAPTRSAVSQAWLAACRLATFGRPGRFLESSDSLFLLVGSLEDVGHPDRPMSLEDVGALRMIVAEVRCDVGESAYRNPHGANCAMLELRHIDVMLDIAAEALRSAIYSRGSE